MKDNDVYQLWVDGSGKKLANGKYINGWGAVLLKNGEIIKHSAGFVIDQTSRRLPIFEALALYNGLILLDDEDSHLNIEIFTDSDLVFYSISQIFKAMFNFSESKSKRKSLKKFIKNLNFDKSFDDYYIEIFDRFMQRNISPGKLKVVKSHSGLIYNDMADELAGLARMFLDTNINKILAVDDLGMIEDEMRSIQIPYYGNFVPSFVYG